MIFQKLNVNSENYFAPLKWDWADFEQQIEYFPLFECNIKNWEIQNKITNKIFLDKQIHFSDSSLLLRFPPPKFYWSRIFKIWFFKWRVASVEVQSLQLVLSSVSLDFFRQKDLCCGCDLWWWILVQMLSLVWTGNPTTW